jgi:hypothetical protein
MSAHDVSARRRHRPRGLGIVFLAAVALVRRISLLPN